MKQRIERHKDGSIKARGHVVDDVLTGYWGVVQKGRQQNAVRIF